MRIHTISFIRFSIICSCAPDARFGGGVSAGASVLLFSNNYMFLHMIPYELATS